MSTVLSGQLAEDELGSRPPTSLIRNEMSPMRGFFDFTALYLDDELRKTLEHLIGFKVLTAQEGRRAEVAT